MTDEKSKKVNLILNEDNELTFKLSIEGTITDPELAKPQFRFTLTEGATDRGWIFPMTKHEDDVFSVSIPAVMTEKFVAGKAYNGKLEVILGRLYFAPSEMEIEFSKGVAVESKLTEQPILKRPPEPKIFVKEMAANNKKVVKNTVAGMTMDHSLLGEQDSPGNDSEIDGSDNDGSFAGDPGANDDNNTGGDQADNSVPSLEEEFDASRKLGPKKTKAAPVLSEQERLKVFYKKFMMSALKG